MKIIYEKITAPYEDPAHEKSMKNRNNFIYLYLGSTYMSFFGNNKNMGTALVIAGIIGLIAAIAAAVTAFTSDGVEDKVPFVVGAVGSMIFALGMLWYGLKVRADPSDDSDVLSGFLRILGIVVIIKAIFDLIATLIGSGDGLGIGSFIIQLIIGLILLWVGQKIAGKSKNFLSKIIWFLLILAFIVLTILEILGILGSFSTDIWVLAELVRHICMCIVYIFGLVLCFSTDVKRTMGV
jgi:hypothetical protein